MNKLIAFIICFGMSAGAMATNCQQFSNKTTRDNCNKLQNLTEQAKKNYYNNFIDRFMKNQNALSGANFTSPGAGTNLLSTTNNAARSVTNDRASQTEQSSNSNTGSDGNQNKQQNKRFYY